MKNHLFLLFILLFALILRLYGLTTENLWFDEFYSIKTALAFPFKMGLQSFVQFAGPVPCLYFLLLKFWMILFGTGVWAVRFFSVLIGILSVGMIYKLGTVFFDKRTGLLAAMLLAVSPAHVFYSQETRQYALFLFLTLMAVFLFYQWVTAKKCWFWFLLVSFCLVNTHFFGILILISFFMVLLLGLDFRRYKDFFWLFLVVLMTSTIGLLLYSDVFQGISRLWWVNKHAILNSLWMIAEFLAFGGRHLGGLDFSVQVIPGAWLITFIFSVLLFFGLWHSFRHKDLRGKILLSWIVVPIALVICINEWGSPVLLGRHVIDLLPACLLAVAWAFVVIAQKNKTLFVVLFLFIIGWSAFQLYSNANHEKRMPIKQIVDKIKERYEPGDIISFGPAFARGQVGFFMEEKHDGVDENFSMNNLVGPVKLYFSFKRGKYKDFPRRIFYIWTSWFDEEDEKCRQLFLTNYAAQYYTEIDALTTPRVTLRVFELNIKK